MIERPFSVQTMHFLSALAGGWRVSIIAQLLPGLLLALGTVLYHSSQHSLEEGLREASEGQQRRW